MHRIAPRQHRQRNHEDAQRWVRELILDLKLRELGEQHTPVTLERLKEWDKFDYELDQCTRPAVYY